MATFLRQRVANLKHRRAAGDSLSQWLFRGLGRYANTYARKLSLGRDGAEELRRKLLASPRLNFGCGYDRREGFVNVDRDPACKPEVLIDEVSVAFFPTSFYETIVAKDVLEHIPRLDTLRMLLLFSDWLAEGGRLDLQTSSILGVADMLRVKNDFSHHYGMVNCLFGSQVHPGDFHYTGFTETTLKVMLLTSGFTFQEFELVDGWLFNVQATRGAPWYVWRSDGADLSDREFMKAVFERAVLRAPNESEALLFADTLARGGRRKAALEVFSLPERLETTARLHGY